MYKLSFLSFSTFGRGPSYYIFMTNFLQVKKSSKSIVVSLLFIIYFCNQDNHDTNRDTNEDKEPV